MKKLLSYVISLSMIFGMTTNVYATSDIIITDDNQIIEDESDDNSIEIIDQDGEETSEDVVIIEDDRSEPESDDPADVDMIENDLSEDDMDLMDGIKLNYHNFAGEDDFESVLDGADDERSYSSSDGNAYPSQYINPDLPALREQNPYGSCWAHATMALAEINLMKQGIMASPDMSEMHLAYFSYNSVVDPLGGLSGDYNALNSSSSFLDVGGNVEYALHVLATWQGVADESKAPYSSAKTVLSDGLPESLAYNDDVYVTNFYKEQYKVDDEINLNPIKELIMRTGVVSISYKHSTNSGVFNTANNCYYNSGTASGGHAVTVVGWDDNFSKSNFTKTPAGDGAWLVRNSWYGSSARNKGYGEYSMYGYFWMSYYEPTIASSVYAAEFTTANEYDNNYEYDGSMASSSITINKLANIFTASSGADVEVIKAVSFATTESNVPYQIQIYTNLSNDTNPTSGTLVATEFGSTDFAGYYTIPLEKEVTINKGKRFSVVVSTTDSSQITLETERNGSSSNWYKSKATIGKGQSFYFNGKSWVDMTPTGFGNLRIKAFTDNYGEEESTPPAVTVTLNPNGGSTSVKSLTLYDTYTGLPTLSRTGYTFDGWYSASIGGTKVSNGSNLVSGADHTLYAHWTEITYTVTLDANGGTSSVGSLTLFGSYSNLPTPARTGYIFDGWYSAITGGTKVVSGDGLISNADHTLHAHWTPITYTIKFNANGGSGSMESLSCNYDTSYSLTANAFSAPAGYKFSKWNTKDDGTGKSYTNSDSVKNLSHTNKAEINLYAQWEAEKYIITLDANGGSTSVSKITVSLSYAGLPTPTRTGYSFLGWFSAKTGGNSVTNGDALVSFAAHTLYAQWSQILYTVTLDACGGTSAVSSLSLYGTYVGLPIPTRTGYSFDGWYSAKTGGIKVVNGTSLLEDAPHALYAHWTEIKYVITLDANGGTSDVSSMSLYGTYSGLPSASRTGYTFAGWYTAKTGGSLVSNNDKLSADADHTLYAHWTQYKYTVKFNANGGSGTMSAMSCDYDSSYTLTANAYTAPAGYKFSKWNTNTDGSGTSYTGSASFKNLVSSNNGSITLYAQWEAVSYTITLDANDGTGSVSRLTNTLVYSGLTEPSRATYTFEGWFTLKTGGTLISNGDDLYTYGDHTLYAHWKEVKNTISLNANGGSVTISSLSLHGSYKDLPTPVRTGYIFTGWYSAATGGTLVANGHDLLANEDHELYAHWTTIKYTVNFNSNGGSGSMASLSCSFDSSYTIPENGFTAPAGYRFTNWNTEADGSGKKYATSVSIKNISSTDGDTFDLYAQWEPVDYIISLDPDDGEISVYGLTNALVYSGLPVSTKAGYSFEGWFTSKNGGTKVSDGDKLFVYEDHTLYAHWSAISYIIKFNANGGSGTMADMTCVYDESYKLTRVGFAAPSGYLFRAWNTKADGSGTSYGDAASIQNLSATNNAQITLYAQWKEGSYTIKLDLGGGTADVTSLVATKKYVGLPTPTRTGYTFTGWYSEKTGGSRIKEGYALISYSDHTIYAQWNVNKYSIKFKSNGGSGSMGSMTCYYDETYTLTENNFKAKSGYEFREWNTMADGSGTSYSNGAVIRNLTAKSDAKIELFAQWDIIHYTISFDANGGTTPKDSVRLALTYSDLPTPSRIGYDFVAWYSAKSGGTKAYDGRRLISFKDHTLHARWKAIKYTVTYNGNGGTGNIKVQNATYDKTHSISGSGFKAPAGYKFYCWNTEPDGSGTSYIKGEKFSNLRSGAGDNIDLYAQWTPVIYNIKLGANGGSVEISSVKNALVYSDLPTPTRVGYIFEGWFTSKTEGVEVHNGDALHVYKAHSIYAHWRAISYTIVFDTNGGDGSVQQIDALYGKSYPVDNTGLIAPSGRKFKEWNTEPDGTGKAYKTTSKFKNMTTTDGDVVTVYAQWK